MDIPDGNTADSSGTENSHALTTTRDTNIQMPNKLLQLMNSVTQLKKLPLKPGTSTTHKTTPTREDHARMTRRET